MTDTNHPAPLTLTDLEELERMEREATGETWHFFKSGILRGPKWIVWNAPHDDGRIMSDEDGSLIVAARNRLPQLLALARVGLLAVKLDDIGVISAIGEPQETVNAIVEFRHASYLWKKGLPK